jgi:GT2 family glycosyltransferase
MRRSLLMQVGFDPAFRGAAEDYDFCTRARAAGAVIAYSARAVAYHEDRGSLRDLIEQRLWYGRGVARMITRYGRHYSNLAAEQMDGVLGATKLNVRYLPFLAVSWGFTAIGMALESLRIACDPALRSHLTRVQLMQDKAQLGNG